MEKKLEIHLDFIAQQMINLGFKSGDDSVNAENRIIEIIAEQYDLFSKIDKFMVKLEEENLEEEMTELGYLEKIGEV